MSRTKKKIRRKRKMRGIEFKWLLISVKITRNTLKFISFMSKILGVERAAKENYLKVKGSSQFFMILNPFISMLIYMWIYKDICIHSSVAYKNSIFIFFFRSSCCLISDENLCEVRGRITFLDVLGVNCCC